MWFEGTCKVTVVFTVRVYGANCREEHCPSPITVHAAWCLVCLRRRRMLKQSGSNSMPLCWSMTCCMEVKRRTCQKIFLSLWEDDGDRATQRAIKQSHLIYFEHWKRPRLSLTLFCVTDIFWSDIDAKQNVINRRIEAEAAAETSRDYRT